MGGGGTLADGGREGAGGRREGAEGGREGGGSQGGGGVRPCTQVEAFKWPNCGPPAAPFFCQKSRLRRVFLRIGPYR